MKISKTLVQVSDDGSLLACDTIEHEGKLWLVIHWMKGQAEGTERPAYMICLHGVPMNQRSANYSAVADRELLIPLSRETLAGGTSQGLVVINGGPDLIRSVDKKLH
jgi:hypothetical protein